MQARRYVLMITAPILATSVLLVALGAAAGWYVHRLNREVSELLARNLECTLASEQLVLGIRDARIQMHRFIDTGDEVTLQTVVTIQSRTSQHLRDALRTATTEDTLQLINETDRAHDKFFADFAIVMQNMPASARQQKVRKLTQTITTDVLAPAEKLLAHTRQIAVEHTNRNRSVADRVGSALLVLGACGAVGGLMAGFGIARGIAKRIEQSEREATRSTQLASVGQLAAGLAHELRNPLTAMRVLVEAAREQSSTGGGLDGRDLEVLDEEMTRLEKLVDSFLDLARPPQLEKAKLDARKLVEQTLHVVAGPARQRGVTIDWRPPAAPTPIEADPVQMRQVLLNLLLNALDATRDGGTVTVELALERSRPERIHAAPSQRDGLHRDDYVAIHVSDNGPGVADDMKEKIFEPFVSGKETGMGLGLSVSRRIVEAHGGTISISDNVERGARFTISLPCGNGPLAPGPGSPAGSS